MHFSMAYFALQIANAFIRKGLADRITVDPLKVQKLVYLSHGWNLAFLKTPLITEAVEAWQYGPVVPELYRAFREFGYSTISKEADEPKDVTPLNEETKSLLREVWAKYGRISGVELSAMTHEQGYAWDLTRQSDKGRVWGSPVIPNEWIRDEFERRRVRA